MDEPCGGGVVTSPMHGRYLIAKLVVEAGAVADVAVALPGGGVDEELLHQVDNLERALSTIDAADDAQKAVATGLELTLKAFSDVLVRFKIEAVDPVGQPFDADLHQAVSMVPNPDLEPNTVMDVFQKGYTLNGRLVRPAMVVVSKAG